MELTKEFLEKYMAIAIEESRIASEQGNGPFGAVIYNKGKVVRAHNTVVTSQDPTAHAEVNAIRKASKLFGIDFDKAILFSSTEPCPMCFSASHWANIGTIVYGASIEDAASLGFRELHIHNKDFLEKGATINIIPGILREKAIDVLRSWKGKPY